MSQAATPISSALAMAQWGSHSIAHVSGALDSSSEFGLDAQGAAHDDEVLAHAESLS